MGNSGGGQGNKGGRGCSITWFGKNGGRGPPIIGYIPGGGPNRGLYRMPKRGGGIPGKNSCEHSSGFWYLPCDATVFIVLAY